MEIKTTGIIVLGICNVQTKQCVAKDKPAPVSVVYQEPSQIQSSVCRPCLDAMVESGQWKIQGAKVFPDQRERMLARAK